MTGFRGDMDLNLDVLNFNDYLSDSIKAMKIDYSTLDIRSEIDSETAIKICKAWGFELIHDVVRKTQFGKKKYTFLYFL